ncbi:MAG: KamA family radical SAM protein [Planctomycetaceae bacterium]|nr:KamA family radical SAM protein [Planctomycetaceae bacterium]
MSIFPTAHAPQPRDLNNENDDFVGRNDASGIRRPMRLDPTADEAATQDALAREASGLLRGAAAAENIAAAREMISANIARIYNECASASRGAASHELIRSRDCARALSDMLTERAEQRGGFSLAGALWDVAADRPRPDLEEGFFAEMIHLVRGLECRAPFRFLVESHEPSQHQGRQAALERSDQLDGIWSVVETKMARYAHGLTPDAIGRREQRRRDILKALGGTESDWHDWKWQTARVIDNVSLLAATVPLTAQEHAAATAAHEAAIPFAVTPYYASLIDETPGADRALRAQVLPPLDYIEEMQRRGDDVREACDFMRETDTSPIDLVTRRYPAIAILKPYNTCPQLCVYCQRNWELKPAMAPGALADEATLNAAIDWIGQHPAIREVLITGGDPLAMPDERLRWILEKVAALDSVDMIRIGSRVPVTMPMRITDNLADMLGSFRRQGARDVALMTHVEHPYEITPDLAAAVNRLKRAGLGVYNQQVFTFYVSRRFETALLRLMLRRIGIDPYYTFAPKAKPETFSYRLPLARLLQERKEEARLLPGLCRTDEPVINLPGLGKNYLRATQHHDLLTVLPDGSRVYEMHPWEKNIVECNEYVLKDMPILDYLRRLKAIGEDPGDYDSIWYYF